MRDGVIAHLDISIPYTLSSSHFKKTIIEWLSVIDIWKHCILKTVFLGSTVLFLSIPFFPTCFWIYDPWRIETFTFCFITIVNCDIVHVLSVGWFKRNNKECLYFCDFSNTLESLLNILLCRTNGCFWTLFFFFLSFFTLLYVNEYSINTLILVRQYVLLFVWKHGCSNHRTPYRGSRGPLKLFQDLVWGWTGSIGVVVMGCCWWEGWKWLTSAWIGILDWEKFYEVWKVCVSPCPQPSLMPFPLPFPKFWVALGCSGHSELKFGAQLYYKKDQGLRAFGLESLIKSLFLNHFWFLWLSS